MDSSTNLNPLRENLPEEDGGEPIEEAPASVFAARPLRPPSTSSSEKYSPVEWTNYFDKEDDISIPGSNDVFHVYMAGTEGPVVFCLHGGGYSGLSFSIVASKIKEKARVVAMDLRGHGKSVSENELDLSLETMSNDVLAVTKELYGDSPPAIVLVGHSAPTNIFTPGTAIASLIHMQKILSNRMQHFPSIQKAIEYSVRGGSLRNIDSARVSIPTTLIYDDSKQCYVYRTRLEETEQYWKGWYEGLSEKFLSSPVPKLLLLAGTDRLDRTLTIGQMQGKFQMIVVKHTGHAIQEDVPEEFANLVLNFISRNRIGPHGVEIPGMWKASQPKA
ncbi:unnamed protein product [Arabis nemorensis]|uniref:Protein phosphatase methylesterase 1 n=1 Tax=Arabis nemorensis TaxID=586526 RepID=A0A565C4Z7_9BRAS|nr:unnamed protein product [Arabis nemorensis]